MSAVEQAVLEALAARAGRVLLEAGARLATAESCTGGWVGQCLTAIPGSSGWFDRGFITYSNEAKVELLDVSEDLLRRQGAVSEATAAAMVLGALAHSRADWALAITGVAGPAGGSAGRPVGTVCFAWADREGAVDTTTRHFSGVREAIRAQSVACALEGLVERVGRCLA